MKEFGYPADIKVGQLLAFYPEREARQMLNWSQRPLREGMRAIAEEHMQIEPASPAQLAIVERALLEVA